MKVKLHNVKLKDVKNVPDGSDVFEMMDTSVISLKD